MQEIIDKIKEHLLKSDNNTIVIEKGDFRKQRKNATSKKSYFTHSDVISEAGSIDAFVSMLSQQGFDNATIYLKSPNGTSTRTVDVLYLQSQQQIQNNHTSVMQHGGFHNTMPINSNYNGYPFGMGVPQQAASNATNERVEILKDRCDELKLENTQLKSENTRLLSENSDLKIENQVVQQKADLEILKAKMDSKSFLESETGKALVSNLPMLLQKKANNVPQAMGNPLGHLSHTKRDFFELVADSKVDDSKVEMLYFLLKNTYEVEGFEEKLKQLLKEPQSTHKNAS